LTHSLRLLTRHITVINPNERGFAAGSELLKWKIIAERWDSDNGQGFSAVLIFCDSLAGTEDENIFCRPPYCQAPM